MCSLVLLLLLFWEAASSAVRAEKRQHLWTTSARAQDPSPPYYLFPSLLLFNVLVLSLSSSYPGHPPSPCSCRCRSPFVILVFICPRFYSVLVLSLSFFFPVLVFFHVLVLCLSLSDVAPPRKEVWKMYFRWVWEKGTSRHPKTYNDWYLYLRSGVPRCFPFLWSMRDDWE